MFWTIRGANAIPFAAESLIATSRMTGNSGVPGSQNVSRTPCSLLTLSGCGHRIIIQQKSQEGRRA
jgi:hypothetical protein